MPAMLEDPTAPVLWRGSSGIPFGTTNDQELPLEIIPRQVTLRDRVTIATIIPFSSPSEVPLTLLAYLNDQLSREIEKGDTYPMVEPLSLDLFGPYWFGVFGAVMLLGDVVDINEVHLMASAGRDWERECLGSFYIKPNYPGRSSHVCNGGFLVTDGARNRGVGRLMGETYLEWAPKLGYSYSVFNLVYETNVASCRIWDSLGFKRIGRVKGCGNLKSYPDQLVDAIIYGRDLGQDDEYVSEERFDKIRFYLKHGKYPNGADRAEKSRLRSAATHYKLVPATGDRAEKLVLKGKEVVSDPQQQYEIARVVHHKSHGGINKTTATIAEQYHWVRIKETVSQVIRNCPECSEMNKNLYNSRAHRALNNTTPPGGTSQAPVPPPPPPDPTQASNVFQVQQREESPSTQLQLEAAQNQAHQQHHEHQHHQQTQHHHGFYSGYLPVDPALMSDSLSTPTPHHHPHHNQLSSFEDLPPSPFLAASNSTPLRMPMDTELELQTPDLPPPLARMRDGDSVMSGTDERPPTVRAEIHRRLTRRSGRGEE
ncbi:histone acetyltransferase Spt10 [Dendryphion nanum]|uniref:Histone acetyltransferase Spt10 n=1 Tax=Dendryphion nanum TaxID=256645 RepID=A0A9P9EJL4_9PLEO|nr:histone acetyltransferase Spt10 [Dendryphion nanum]